MSIYQKLMDAGSRFMGKSKLFKFGFNYSPMYRRSTARITEVSEDLRHVKIKLPISYKNRNYVNSIFGGSMFAAVDPIPMIQLMHIIGNEYIVWDKSAEIYFKRPAREHLYAEFNFTNEDLEQIKEEVKQNKETHFLMVTQLTNQAGTVVYCEVKKTIYIAEKTHYLEKRKSKS